MKAIVLVIDGESADERAPQVARLIAATLSLNGIPHNEPSVIEWPAPATVTVSEDAMVDAAREICEGRSDDWSDPEDRSNAMEDARAAFRGGGISA